MLNAPLIAGRYEPLGLLGSGGMGDVYLADDHLLSRRVALKLLKKHLAEDADALARFRKEALAAASLSHPNIVRVFDAGEGEPDGVPYIAMEEVPGGTLAHRLEREGRLRPSDAARIAQRVALALTEAHAKGIVHRDVKPQNVLLDEAGEPKVTDFGIALAASSASTALTRTAMIVGTARYLSPEQAQGHVATEKSDLYSLGVVLYEMLTGRVPFEADNPVALALKHVTDQPLRPRSLEPGIPRALDAATLRLLSKRPADRPRNAAVAARMLQDASARSETSPAASEPTAKIASPVHPRARGLAKRRRRGLAVAGVLCAGLLAIPVVLAQPAFLRDAYLQWSGTAPQTVGRAPSPTAGSGDVDAPAPVARAAEPAKPVAPTPASEQPPPPQPDPPAYSPPPVSDPQTPQYAAGQSPAAPPPQPVPQTHPAPQPQPTPQAPPMPQPRPAPQEPPAPQPRPAAQPTDPAQPPVPAQPSPRPAPEPAPAPRLALPNPPPRQASPAPQQRQNPVPQTPRVIIPKPPRVNVPMPKTFPGGQAAEQHAGRRR